MLAAGRDEPKPLDELLVCATSAGFFFDATSVVKTMTAPMPMLLLCFKLQHLFLVSPILNYESHSLTESARRLPPWCSAGAQATTTQREREPR